MYPNTLKVTFLFIVLALFTRSYAQMSVQPGTQRICHNSNTIIRVNNVSFANSTYLWQDSSATGWNTIIPNANYSGHINDTLSIFNANASLHNRKYRCIVDSAGLGIRKDTIGNSLLLVRTNLIKAQLSSSQNICHLAPRDTVKIAQHPQGGDTSFFYQWQFSVNGTNWSLLLNPDSNFVLIDTLSRSVYYRLKTISKAGCGEKVSDSVFININSALQKPTLFKANFFVCYLSNPDSLYITNPNVLYNYQWQFSSDSINFVNLTNDNGFIKQSVQAISTKLFYRLVATQKNGCGVVISDTARVLPYSTIIKPSISGTQTICYDVNPDTLRITPHSSTGNEVQYQWQSSINGTTWVDIPLATDKKLGLSKNGITKFYRVKAVWPGNCGVIFTDSVLVSVFAELVPGIIKTNQSICYGYSPGILSFQSLPTGGGDSYTYQWQISSDSINFTNIPTATNFIYQPALLFNTSYYRIRITSIQNCGVVFSNVVKIKVFENFVGPSISAYDTICYNARPDTLRISIPAIGGNGIYNYQWQQSTSGGIWQNVSGQNSSKFQPNAITVGTYYRLITSALPNCGIDTSNSVFIKVWPKLVKPRINANQNICYNSSADTLRLTQVAQGGNNVFTYQWQMSDDGFIWNDLAGQNAIKFSPGVLTSTKYYRIKAVSSFGCGSITSDSIKVNVYANLQSGVLLKEQTICYNSIPNKLEFGIRPSGGGGLFTYQWQVSNDSINFTNISSANSDFYQASVLNSTKYYRVLVSSTFGCGTVSSNVIKIKVYEQFVGATIGNSNKVCFGYVPVPLFMTNKPSGGSKNYVYQWQNSTDSINWFDIAGQTAELLPMVQNPVTTYFRLINASTELCGIDTSNVVTIVSLKLPDTTNVLGLNSVCRNQQELFYKLEIKSNQYHYEWTINKGEILTNPLHHAVFITWNNEIGIDTIYVKQTDKISGCFNYMKFPVSLEPELAPNKTEIARKSSTNILVCKDTTIGLNYQWGYVDRGTSTVHELPNSNLRYVQLPHTFDSSMNLYFVKTWFNSCVTTTFMNGTDLSIGKSNNKLEELEVYPNPSNGFVYINNINLQEAKINCYNLIGEAVNVIVDDKHKITLEQSIPPGIYMLKIIVNDSIYNAKIVLE